MSRQLALAVLPGRLAICRLAADLPVPPWAYAGPFCSVTHTNGELSIVCSEEAVPAGATCSRGWRCLMVSGPLDLALIGVLASLVQPLAAAEIAVFAVSTYDTDYLLVRDTELPRALEALRKAGHSVGQWSE